MFGERHGRRSAAGVRLVAVGVVLATAFVMMVGSASAEPATTCVKATVVKPPKPVKAHHTGGYNNKECTEANATHEGNFEKLVSLSPQEEGTLKALLAHVKVEEKGIDEKPTVQFTGANVQVVNGEGATTEVVP